MKTAAEIDGRALAGRIGEGFEAAEKEERIVEGVRVSVSYADAGAAPVDDAEVRAYIERGNAQHPHSAVTALSLRVDGDEVDIRYELSPAPFERIRRITGYLVGTMDRWNDAKTCEERDRVKHGLA